MQDYDRPHIPEKDQISPLAGSALPHLVPGVLSPGLVVVMPIVTVPAVVGACILMAARAGMATWTGCILIFVTCIVVGC